ncbi:hypothetical protein [Methanobacterium bryantii]|uniref:AlgX/AlgJ SGNH hydrolase-like domain-containing protein n=1 Tax=Methanobacterium bryantii TaxID=2161 RepID=A0A2A2HAL6_METBR|nr:hypothetical protein [Methanobacterium bryantii]PAV06294.1 hypothetical protein ASJ80_15815 [Methanobacterium bryantii]
MITFTRYEDLLIANDLEKVDIGKYRATGNDPYFEIRNLPDGLIQEISIELKAENGEIIEFYWTYEKNESYSPALRSSQRLISGTTDVYRFLLDSEKEIKRLRLDPTNASGMIEIKEIKIYYLLEEEKEKFITVPNYKNIGKITLKGQNGNLFLINDSNHEIRQHFDYSFNNNFNEELFIKNLDFKKEICNNRNINYFFFLIPDKSLVCKNFLPFDVKIVKRNYDLIKNSVPDFIKNLDYTCYFKNDSHINYLGGKELAYCYLNYIDNNFGRDDFDRVLTEQISTIEHSRDGDLTFEKNWSYSNEEKIAYLNEKIISLKNEYLVNLDETIPEKFKVVSTRKTEYYKNPQGLKNLRVLIFRDSSLDFLKDVLSVYFKDILLYWDHWFFNKELICWYKPDIILEIRTERFLENMKLYK